MPAAPLNINDYYIPPTSVMLIENGSRLELSIQRPGQWILTMPLPLGSLICNKETILDHKLFRSQLTIIFADHSSETFIGRDERTMRAFRAELEKCINAFVPDKALTATTGMVAGDVFFNASTTMPDDQTSQEEETGEQTEDVRYCYDDDQAKVMDDDQAKVMDDEDDEDRLDDKEYDDTHYDDEDEENDTLQEQMMYDDGQSNYADNAHLGGVIDELNFAHDADPNMEFSSYY